MMNQVYTKLPDDRPITSLCVVEDPERCPEGYMVISKTFDQDYDADLWKESGFFGRKYSRYLCISKTEGEQNFAVQSLCIIHEKDNPPPNFKSIPKTIDSEQKAWRKKQICFKYTQISASPTVISDIIILGRTKKVPTGFVLLNGEINGLTICYKVRNSVLASQIPYPIIPSGAFGNTGNNLKELGNNSSRPFRPAPKPPTQLYSTLTAYKGLEGVPFVFNPKYSIWKNEIKNISLPKIKTKSQIDEEYHYEFKTELEA